MNDLSELLAPMDVPENRFQDLHWLVRNLAIRNQEHPNYAQAMSLVHRLIRESSEPHKGKD